MRSPLVLAYSNPPSCLCRVCFYRKLLCSTHVWVLLWPHRYHQKEQALSELALTIARQSLWEPYEAEERVPSEGNIMYFGLSVVCTAHKKAKNHSRVLDEILLFVLFGILGAPKKEKKQLTVSPVARQMLRKQASPSPTGTLDHPFSQSIPPWLLNVW